MTPTEGGSGDLEPAAAAEGWGVGWGVGVPCWATARLETESDVSVGICVCRAVVRELGVAAASWLVALEPASAVTVTVACTVEPCSRRRWAWASPAAAAEMVTATSSMLSGGEQRLATAVRTPSLKLSVFASANEMPPSERDKTTTALGRTEGRAEGCEEGCREGCAEGCEEGCKEPPRCKTRHVLA